MSKLDTWANAVNDILKKAEKKETKGGQPKDETKWGPINKKYNKFMHLLEECGKVFSKGSRNAREVKGEVQQWRATMTQAQKKIESAVKAGDALGKEVKSLPEWEKRIKKELIAIQKRLAAYHKGAAAMDKKLNSLLTGLLKSS